MSGVRVPPGAPCHAIPNTHFLDAISIKRVGNFFASSSFLIFFVGLLVIQKDIIRKCIVVFVGAAATSSTIRVPVNERGDLSPYEGQGNAKDVFFRIGYEAGCKLPQVDEVWKRIVGHYEEDHRHYHTMQHIDEVVTFCLLMATEENNKTALLLAAIFHDIVYDTRRSDNEEASALVAAGYLAFLLRADDALDTFHTVERLILGTRDHQADPDDRDACVLYDADLLRLSSAEHLLWTTQVRLEYSWVPNDVFYRERGKILKTFLQREHIYALPSVRYAYEAAARRNIHKYIETWERVY